MSDHREGDEASMCEIIGCSGHGTTTRWVMEDKDGGRQITVCWKHAEGEITPDQLEPQKS
ncbi:MAG TPA: hypothetical protein VF115_12205 [Acidimicrobiia bacterium]